MDLSRRDFFQIAAALGLGLPAAASAASTTKRADEVTLKDIYDFKARGNVTLLHICDMHAHIKPLYWREPSTLISAPNLTGTPGFLCGESFLNYYGMKGKTLDAYFDTYMNFDALAHKFGKMGGISHMKTLINHIKKERGADNVLLLDSILQGTALRSKQRANDRRCTELSGSRRHGRSLGVYLRQTACQN